MIFYMEHEFTTLQQSEHSVNDEVTTIEKNSTCVTTNHSIGHFKASMHKNIVASQNIWEFARYNK